MKPLALLAPTLLSCISTCPLVLAKHTGSVVHASTTNETFEATCPFPQFELFGSSSGRQTPFADQCITSFTIRNGSCAGASVWMKAVGVFTHVIDVQSPRTEAEWSCTGQDLLQAALFTPTVRVPSAYFGLGGKPGDCLEFPAAMQTFNKFEQYMVNSFNKVQKECSAVRGNGPGEGGGGSGSGSFARSGTIVHANSDLDNLNLWHSLAQLHTLWSASQTLSGSGRELRGHVDVTSGKCHCDESTPLGAAELKGAHKASHDANQVVSKGVLVREAAEEDASSAISHAKDILLGSKQLEALQAWSATKAQATESGLQTPPVPAAQQRLLDGNGNSKDNSKRVLARLKTHQRWPFPLAPLKHKEHHSEGRVGVARVFACARLLSEALEGLRDLLASEAKSRVAQPEKPSSPVPLASSTSAAAKTQQKTSSRSSALALCLEYVNQALGEVKNDVGLLEGLQGEAQLLLKHQTQQHTGASSTSAGIISLWSSETGAINTASSSASEVADLLAKAADKARFAHLSSSVVLALDTVALASEAFHRALKSTAAVFQDTTAPLASCLAVARLQVSSNQISGGSESKEAQQAGVRAASEEGATSFSNATLKCAMMVLRAQTTGMRSDSGALEEEERGGKEREGEETERENRREEKEDMENFEHLEYSVANGLAHMKAVVAEAWHGWPLRSVAEEGHLCSCSLGTLAAASLLLPTRTTGAAAPTAEAAAAAAAVRRRLKKSRKQKPDEQSSSSSSGDRVTSANLARSSDSSVSSIRSSSEPSSEFKRQQRHSYREPLRTNGDDKSNGDRLSAGQEWRKEDEEVEEERGRKNDRINNEDKLRVLRQHNESHCYHRHVFVVRHRKRGPVNPGGWPEPQAPSYRGAESPFSLSRSAAKTLEAAAQSQRPYLQAQLKLKAKKKHMTCLEAVEELERKREKKNKVRHHEQGSVNQTHHKDHNHGQGGSAAVEADVQDGGGGGSGSSDHSGSSGGGYQFGDQMSQHIDSLPKGCEGEERAWVIRKGLRVDPELGAPKSLFESSSCGQSVGGYWNAISGLLWDSKLCASDFKCKSPPAFRAFMADVRSVMGWDGAPLKPVPLPQDLSVPSPPEESSVAAGRASGVVSTRPSSSSSSSSSSRSNEKVDTFSTSHSDVGGVSETNDHNSAASGVGTGFEEIIQGARRRSGSGSDSGRGGGVSGQGRTLCYMSRGVGLRRGGMEDEEALRAFVLKTSSTTSSGGGRSLGNKNVVNNPHDGSRQRRQRQRRRLQQSKQQRRRELVSKRGRTKIPQQNPKVAAASALKEKEAMADVLAKLRGTQQQSSSDLKRANANASANVEISLLPNGKSDANVASDLSIYSKRQEGEPPTFAERSLANNKKENVGGSSGISSSRNAMKAAMRAPSHGCARAAVLDFTEGSTYHKIFTLQAGLVHSQCDILLGPHGAGMAHLIWMTPPVKPEDYDPITEDNEEVDDERKHDSHQQRQLQQHQQQHHQHHHHQHSILLDAGSERRTVIEFIGLDPKTNSVSQPWYYHHLSEIAGLDYRVFSEFLPSVMPPDWEDPEDLGLTPSPEFTQLAAFLLPLCTSSFE